MDFIRFGEQLKSSRLHARLGLRKFASLINMKPSELSDIERGYIDYPRDEEWLYKISDILGMIRGSKEEFWLYGSWAYKPFTMQLMDEDVFICHATSIDGKPLDEDGLIKLSDYMSDYAKEHNIKAREFNKRNK